MIFLALLLNLLLGVWIVAGYAPETSKLYDTDHATVVPGCPSFNGLECSGRGNCVDSEYGTYCFCHTGFSGDDCSYCAGDTYYPIAGTCVDGSSQRMCACECPVITILCHLGVSVTAFTLAAIALAFPCFTKCRSAVIVIILTFFLLGLFNGTYRSWLVSIL